MLTIEQLSGCFPDVSSATLQTFLPGVNGVAAKCQINTPLRMRAFLAQTGVESGEFKFLVENLNYSAAGLRATFPREFPTTALANQYARKPQAIANRVYANRMGNGDEASGDGWTYRGRGLLQITGKNNYTACMSFLGVTDPNFLATPDGAVLSAGWFWLANNLNRWADGQDMVSLTRAITGALTGYQARMVIYNRSKSFIF